MANMFNTYDTIILYNQPNVNSFLDLTKDFLIFALAEEHRTWTLQLNCSQFCPPHLGQGSRLVQDHQHESTHYRIMFCSAPAESSDELHPILLRGALLQLEAISAQGLRECAAPVPNSVRFLH